MTRDRCFRFLLTTGQPLSIDAWWEQGRRASNLETERPELGLKSIAGVSKELDPVYTSPYASPGLILSEKLGLTHRGQP